MLDRVEVDTEERLGCQRAGADGRTEKAEQR